MKLRPVFNALVADLKRSTKLFMDETVPQFSILAPARPRPDTSGRWRGMIVLGAAVLPPGVAFTYAPSRGGIHAERILQGFSGILQVDGYAGYNRLIAPERVVQTFSSPIVGPTPGGSWWRSPATAQRPLLKTASNGLENCIASKPTCAALILKLALQLGRNDQRTRRRLAWLACPSPRTRGHEVPAREALAYIAKYWDGLKLFLTDGASRSTTTA